MLEKVIFVRDWHLSLLENYGPPAFKQPDDRALDASPAALAKATNSLADNGYSPLLVKNVSECEATPAWKKAFTIPLPRPKTGHFTSAMPHLEAEYVAAFNQKVAEVPETVMQMFKSMPLPEVVKQWKEFIDKVGCSCAAVSCRPIKFSTNAISSGIPYNSPMVLFRQCTRTQLTVTVACMTSAHPIILQPKHWTPCCAGLQAAARAGVLP